MQKLLSFTRINITVTKHWPFKRTQHSELINVEFTIHSYTLDWTDYDGSVGCEALSLLCGLDPIRHWRRGNYGRGPDVTLPLTSLLSSILLVSCMYSTAAYFDYSLQYNDKNSVLLLLYHFETPICLHSTMSVRISHDNE